MIINTINFQDVQQLKDNHRPYMKSFKGKPNERTDCIRRRTRPWDNCWFSNKPHIISLTVEQAIKAYPSYMLWCYSNLRINWSVHTIKLFDQIKPKDFRFKYNDRPIWDF